VTAFIEEHRGEFGVEPMCKMLQIAQSTYYERRAIARDPDRASARAKSDADLCIKINAAWEENRKLYGARKVWHVLLRDNQEIARCTVERLMRSLGIKGVVRGKKVVTTNPDTSQPCPDDKVNRLFKANRPNQLWGEPLSAIGPRTMASDFTYVPTWSGTVSFRGLRGPTGATVPYTFRHRCLCAPHRWLARIDINGDAVRSPLSAFASQKPAGQRTLWIKQSGKGKRLITMPWFTTQTVDRNISRSSMPSVLSKSVLIHRLEQSAIPMTMLSLNASLACSKPRSSTRSVRGNRCAKSNGKR
jgi:hypothetical protein